MCRRSSAVVAIALVLCVCAPAVLAAGRRARHHYTVEADACAVHTDCASCIADKNCGYYAPAIAGPWSCVTGDQFTCQAPLCNVSHLYVKSHCPLAIDEPIMQRRAIRQYLDVPVDADTIKALLTLATWAPSANGLEPWRFYVSTNRTTLDAISAAVQKAGGLTFDVFYGAPVVVFIFTQGGTTLFEDVDAGLAVQNLMEAAHNYGLGSCPIGLARQYGEDVIRKATGATADMHFVLPVILGHPAVAATHTRNPPVIVNF